MVTLNHSFILDKFKKSPFTKNVALVAGGTAAAQAITILSTPIITRIYTPADFGVFTVFLAVLGIIGQVSTLRYSVTIPLADKDDLANNVLKLCFLISISLSAFLGMNLLLLGDFFVTRFSISLAAPYLWLLPLGLLGTGLYEALSSWGIRKKQFKMIARTKLSQALSSSAIKIGLGWLGIIPLGLLLGLLASKVAGSGGILIRLLKENPRFFASISWSGIAHAARRYSKFPLIQTWSRLLFSLSTELPVLLMAAIYDTQVAGLFGLAHRMVNMPMNLLGASVAQVYYAEIAKYGKERPDKIRRLSITTAKTMFLVAIIPTVILIIAGPSLFAFVFGARWRDAGVYASILAIYLLFRFASSPLVHCFDVFELHLTRLIITGTRVIMIVCIFTLSKSFGFTPFQTVMSLSMFLSLHYLSLCMVIFCSIARQQKANKPAEIA